MVIIFKSIIMNIEVLVVSQCYLCSHDCIKMCLFMCLYQCCLFSNLTFLFLLLLLSLSCMLHVNSVLTCCMDSTQPRYSHPLPRILSHTSVAYNNNCTVYSVGRAEVHVEACLKNVQVATNNPACFPSLSLLKQLDTITFTTLCQRIRYIVFM